MAPKKTAGSSRARDGQQSQARPAQPRSADADQAVRSFRRRLRSFWNCHGAGFSGWWLALPADEKVSAGPVLDSALWHTQRPVAVLRPPCQMLPSYVQPQNMDSKSTLAMCQHLPSTEIQFPVVLCAHELPTPPRPPAPVRLPHACPCCPRCGLSCRRPSCTPPTSASHSGAATAPPRCVCVCRRLLAVKCALACQGCSGLVDAQACLENVGSGLSFCRGRLCAHQTAEVAAHPPPRRGAGSPHARLLPARCARKPPLRLARLLAAQPATACLPPLPAQVDGNTVNAGGSMLFTPELNVADLTAAGGQGLLKVLSRCRAAAAAGGGCCWRGLLLAGAAGLGFPRDTECSAHLGMLRPKLPPAAPDPSTAAPSPTPPLRPARPPQRMAQAQRADQQDAEGAVQLLVDALEERDGQYMVMLLKVPCVCTTCL